jgi:glucose/mannose-6-phosphate isomerase
MIDLDNPAQFSSLDPADMLGEIDRLPDQLHQAWELGLSLPLPAWTGIQQVLVAGMGGSAIGADLLAAYASPLCPAPLVVHRDYDLPAWGRGPHTLVIASSHSGNTEETLSAWEQAAANGCRVIAVSTGGRLAELARQAGAPDWRFTHAGQPRAAVGYSFGLLLAILARLHLLPDPAAELAGALEAMRRQQARLRAGVGLASNPAKRLAGQLLDRYVTVYGAGVLAPVARRWKGQIGEIAKAGAGFELLPEADHNTLAGVVNPADVLQRTASIFLRAPSCHPRNRLRADLTRKVFMLEGLNTDTVDAAGDTPLAHQWTALHFGDYTAYYLAMAYGIDPTPVQAIEALKLEMKAAGD